MVQASVEEEENKQEAAVMLDALRQISMDAAVIAVLARKNGRHFLIKRSVE